jgi:hypothetical protein
VQIWAFEGRRAVRGERSKRREQQSGRKEKREK